MSKINPFPLLSFMLYMGMCVFSLSISLLMIVIMIILHFISMIKWTILHITRPPLERRKTLGHLRSINPNMINHYASQSQTCQLLKILKNIFFSNKENVESGAINFRLNWYTKSISIIERSYIYIYMCVCVWSSWHRILMISRNLPGGR